MTTEVYNLIKRKSKLLIMVSVVILAILALVSTELKLEFGLNKQGLNLRVETRH